MIEFQNKYIEDANELISKLESELISFENNMNNEELIQELFRVMHTLKGTSGMFGFHRIESLTHLLEDIYDLIRNHKLSINTEIFNLTFEAVDLLKILLITKEKLNSEQEELFSKVEILAKKYSLKSDFIEVKKEVAKTEITDVVLYRIVFKPDKDILLRGIKPFAIIEELLELALNKNFQFTDESIEIENEDTFNQFWEVYLSGTVTNEQIIDVFTFIDENEYSVFYLTENTPKALNEFLKDSECVKKNISIDVLINDLQTIIKQEQKKAVPVVEKTEEKTIKTISTGSIDESIRVPALKLDNLLNLVSELIMIHAQFENHAERLQDEKLFKSVEDLSKISRNFRDEILSTRLIPIAVIATAMQRLVRDLAKKLNKEIELITEGLQTELDKNIISKIENPLMHIIRNCIDHGIEHPEVRVLEHKIRCGKIRFIAFYSGASVFIQIQDDGQGINLKKIVEKAITKGIVKYDTVLTNKQIYDLLFIPGFSTASEITEVSGRGVGLDVVKNVITELHGEINVDSEIGLGTSFTIKLPLTLSIIDALLVHCNKYKILIPTSNIIICKFLSADFFANKDLQYQFNNKCVPVKRLSDIFESNHKVIEFEVLIIICIYEKYFGLLVDKIITSMQAVIKPLGPMHKKQPYFIGASQMGDGSMAYILDTNFLLKIE